MSAKKGAPSAATGDAQGNVNKKRRALIISQPSSGAIASVYPNAGRVVATYNYRDAAGELLYTIVRFEPKNFRPVRPGRNGRLIAGLGYVERVPYHLPDVLAAIAAGDVVLITEGEKSADALAALGFPATCNDGGAGKWGATQSAYLAGAHVVLFEDNDEAGRKHVAKAAGALAAAGAASISVVSFPDQAEKYDVADFIADGATRADIEQLIAAAPTWTVELTDITGLLLAQLSDLAGDQAHAAAGGPALAGDHRDADLPAAPPPVDSRLWDSYVFGVGALLGVKTYKSNGWSRKPIKCPFHDDKNPSASWHINGVLHCHACGETWNAKATGAALGFSWDDYAARHAPLNRSARRRAGDRRRRRVPDQERATGPLPPQAGYPLPLAAGDIPPPVTAPGGPPLAGDEWTPEQIAAYERWFKNLVTAGAPAGADIRTFTAPYVTQAGLDLTPVSIIRSPMGTGKTQLIADRVAGLTATARVLVIVHRRSLAGQLAARIPYAVNYEDLKDKRDLANWPIVVVCINSLHYLQDHDGDTPTFEYVILEESEALAEHVDGGTLDAFEQTRAVGALRHAIGKCLSAGGRVLALDAGATRVTHELVEMLAGRAPTWFVNEFQPNRPAIVLHESKDDLLALVHQAHAAGEKVYFCTDHKREARALSHEYPGVMIGLWQGADDVGARMATLDDDLEQFGGISASPTLDAGVDIQTPARVFGMFHGNSNSVLSQWQQLGRVRNPIGEIHVFYQERHEASEPGDYNPDVVEKQILATDTALLKKTIFVDDPDAVNERVMHPDQQLAVRLRALVTARKNLHRRNRRLAFIALAEAKGYQVVEAEIDPALAAAAKHAKDRRRDALAAIKTEDRALLLAADPVNGKTYRALQAAGEVTQEIEAGNTRWRYERVYGETLTDDLADEAERYRYLTTPGNFLMLRRDITDLLHRDREQAETLTALGAMPALVKLRFRAGAFRLFEYLMRCAFGGTGSIAEAYTWQWTEADLGDFLQAVEENRLYVQRLWGIRPRQFRQEHAAQNILRAILRAVGLDVDGKQIMRDGQRFMAYRVSPERLDRMGELTDNLAAALDIELPEWTAQIDDSYKLDSLPAEEKPIHRSPPPPVDLVDDRTPEERASAARIMEMLDLIAS